MGFEDRYLLLVEDSEDDVDLTVRAFRKNNIQNHIEIARDGQAALDFLLGVPHKPLPEVVLLDIRLPRLDGFQVLERIRADSRTRLLPVVMLTSSSQEEDIVRSYGTGANSYVQKPVSLPAFMEAVRSLGLYWLLLNRRDTRHG